MRPSPLPLLLLAGALLLAGCTTDDRDRLVLDGRPRVPDVEGVVQQISFEKITLDGDRSFGVRKDLQSFSTYDLAAVPMLQRSGQYVHLGLDGKKVAWMAMIGEVIEGPAPVVYYNGVLLRLEGDRAVFRDGTVLQLADGVTSPVGTGFVRAELDPSLHRVRALVLP
ncbi:MAG TPA: hypothetical protein VJS45_09955 [Acidimicrobiia bacterium]|nr:hypothetical protein [Acidimicrobiia bacterium]